MTDLTSPIYADEDAARAHLESLRWPNGPVCPHCGSVENLAKVGGAKKSHRPGLYYCNGCKGQFTVMVGSVFERSHVPLHKWVLAYRLLCSSKKGISSHQLHRMLGVTYKTAWFMSHRIRESMRETTPEGLGGSGKVVEADETYFGKREDAQPSPHRKGRPFTKRGKTGPAGNRAVLGWSSAPHSQAQKGTKNVSKPKVTLKLKDYTYTPGDAPRLKARFSISSSIVTGEWEITQPKAWDVKRALEDCRTEIQEFAKLLAEAASDPELLKIQ